MTNAETLTACFENVARASSPASSGGVPPPVRAKKRTWTVLELATETVALQSI